MTTEKPVNLDLGELRELAKRFEQIDKTSARGEARTRAAERRLDDRNRRNRVGRDRESAQARRGRSLPSGARSDRAAAGVGGLAKRLAAPVLGFLAVDKAFELTGQIARAVFESKTASQVVGQLVSGLVPEVIRPFLEQAEKKNKQFVELQLDAFATEQKQSLRAELGANELVRRDVSRQARDQYAQTPEGKRLMDRAGDR